MQSEFPLTENQLGALRSQKMSNNTYFTLAALKASNVAEGTAFLAQDPTTTDGLFYWKWASFTGQADDNNIIESDNEPLSSGAWIRQSAQTVAFLQSGTNAVTRKSQDKMREIASVKDFGAKGDGVTDDSAAFTGAMTASRTVFVPSGTYAVENLSVPDGVTLRGAGSATTLRLPTGSIYRLFVTTGANDWTIENMTLDAGGTGTSIALFTTCVGATLRNIWATGAAGHGIEFDNCGACTIDTIDLYNTGSESSSSALYLKNLTGNGSSNRVSNIRFRDINGRGLVNVGNNLTQITALRGDMTNGEILFFEDSTSCVASNIIMTGNEPLVGPLSDGIALNGNSFYNVIDGFHVSNNSGHGVSINGQREKTGASYNTVSNGVVVNPDQGGVVITDQGEPGSFSVGNIVSNVVVQNAGKDISSEAFGVSGGTDNQFSNCTALDTQMTPTTSYGFLELNGENSAARNSFTGRLIAPFATRPYSLVSPTSAVHEATARTTDTWVTFDGVTGAAATILAASNVSSVTRNSAGNYTIALGEAVLANAPITATAAGGTVALDNTPSSTIVTIQVRSNGTPNDSDYICLRIG